MKKYYPRLIDKQLERKLHSIGCILVSGPKFCGKTTTCERFAKSETKLITTNAIRLGKADPQSCLIGEEPHLIDEWQKVPELWNLIKSDLDDDYQFGKYIITGSTTPIDTEEIQHSGAGRISKLIMRPFSLFESNESNGRVSLSGLFERPFNSSQTLSREENPFSLTDVAQLLCRGGWPMALKAQQEYAMDVTQNYYDGLFTIEDESDEFAVFLKNKNIDLLKLILKEYARNISTEAKKSSMIRDILSSGEREKLDEDTFDQYVKTLKDLFIIYDMPAWNLNLRSSVSVRSTPTHHFFDPSIALAALNIKSMDLLNDLRSMGFFFEDLAVRDLAVYCDSINATLKHYRDSNGLEVDAIVELANGDYAAIEIKIASEENIQAGISSLRRFRDNMERNNLKLPKYSMVLTSHGNCYRADDNIYIVPINCLKD